MRSLAPSAVRGGRHGRVVYPTPASTSRGPRRLARPEQLSKSVRGGRPAATHGLDGRGSGDIEQSGVRSRRPNSSGAGGRVEGRRYARATRAMTTQPPQDGTGPPCSAGQAAAAEARPKSQRSRPIDRCPEAGQPGTTKVQTDSHTGTAGADGGPPLALWAWYGRRESPVLSIGRLGAASEDYYLAVVASGVEDYYLAEGEAPGRWLSDGGLELAGEVAGRGSARAAGRPRPAQRRPAGAWPRGAAAHTRL